MKCYIVISVHFYLNCVLFYIGMVREDRSENCEPVGENCLTDKSKGAWCESFNQLTLFEAPCCCGFQ